MPMASCSAVVQYSKKPSVTTHSIMAEPLSAIRTRATAEGFRGRIGGDGAPVAVDSVEAAGKRGLGRIDVDWTVRQRQER